MVRGPARIGRKNVFDSFCSVGGDPQDLKFGGEHTELVVGDANRFREFCTVSRGTTRRRRRHADRQRQSLHGVFPRGARLHRRQPHRVCQWRDAGRPRGGGGLRERRRVQSRAPILPRGPLRLHRRLHRDHAGRAAVFARGHRARNEMLRREHRRPRAPRIRSRAPGNHRERVSPSAALQAQHHAGPRTDSRATERFARCSGTRGIYRIGASAACTSEFLDAYAIFVYPGRFRRMGIDCRQRTISVSGSAKRRATRESKWP